MGLDLSPLAGVASPHLEVPFTTTTAQAVGVTEVGDYRHFSVQITGQGTSSTVTFQGSNDNATWVSVPAMVSTSVSLVVFSSTATGIYSGPLNFRYFRLNVTGISAGTTAGVIEFFGTASAPQLVTSVSATITQATTATLTNVAASVTSTSLVASNASRKGLIVYNDSTSALYVKFGATASATSFTFYVPAGSHLEVLDMNFTGAVDGIWVSAVGTARVTELT